MVTKNFLFGFRRSALYDVYNRNDPVSFDVLHSTIYMAQLFILVLWKCEDCPIDKVCLEQSDWDRKRMFMVESKRRVYHEATL